MRVRLVPDEFEVLECKIEYRLYVGIHFHCGQRERLAPELFVGLIKVVQVQMSISERVHETPGASLQTCATIIVSSA